MPITRVSDNEATTQALAAAIAKHCKIGDCILLQGDLGTGKTTFARGFIQALCDVTEDIVSPTFTLAQTYDTRGGEMVWHFDLYRLKKPEEIWEVGLEDALLTGISLIEWPQMASDYLPKQVIDIHIAYGAGPNERYFTIEGIKAL